MNMISSTFAKPTTFGDLIGMLESDPDPELAKTQRRRDALSAIRRFTELLAIDLESAAGVRAYRNKIDTFQPGQHGLKDKRWSTIRSDVGFALARYGIVERHRPLPEDLSPAWRALRETASAIDVGLFRRLSPYVYFCNRTGIAPENVNDTTVVDFLESRADSLRKTKRNTMHRELCTCWNRAVKMAPGWPQVHLTVPNFRNSYSLSRTAFPQSFQDELARWQDIHAGKFPLAPKAPKRPMRPSTLRTRSEQVRRFASALVHSGVPVERITSLAVLAEPENFRLGLEYFLGRAGNRSTPSIEETALGIYYIAVHWVKAADADLAKLKEFCEHVRCRERGLTTKNMERLRQFNDPLNVLRIVTLPETLEAAARKIATSPSTTATIVTGIDGGVEVPVVASSDPLIKAKPPAATRRMMTPIPIQRRRRMRAGQMYDQLPRCMVLLSVMGARAGGRRAVLSSVTARRYSRS
jgi:hypothetical protein